MQGVYPRTITDLFDRYRYQANAALNGNLDIAALSNIYNEAFVRSSSEGIYASQTDDIEQFRSMRAIEVEIVKINMESFDSVHKTAYVTFLVTTADEGHTKIYEHENVYLIRIDNQNANIFCCIDSNGIAGTDKDYFFRSSINVPASRDRA